MKGETARNYIVGIFRTYAEMNYPDITEIKKIEDETIVNDMLSVFYTLKDFEEVQKYHITAAIKEVYFKNPDKQLRKGDIQNRVKQFAFENYYDESSVWRWLKSARIKCAKYRGLSIKCCQ